VHRSLLLTVAIAGVATTITAGNAATTPADAGRVAATQVTFALGHGRTLSLEFRAAELSGGDVLRVLAQRCFADGNCLESAYQSPLRATSLTIDANAATAELTATIAGRRLHVQWRPAATQGVVVSSGEMEGNGVSNDGSTYVGDPAAVVVQLDDRTCHGDGAVGNGVLADTGTATGSPSAQDVGALRVPAAAPLTCS
jgi:hypothetical protein